MLCFVLFPFVKNYILTANIILSQPRKKASATHAVQRGLMPRTSSQTFMKVKRSTFSGMWPSCALVKWYSEFASVFKAVYIRKMAVKKITKNWKIAHHKMSLRIFFTYPPCTSPWRCGLHPSGHREWRCFEAQPRYIRLIGFPAPFFV